MIEVLEVLSDEDTNLYEQIRVMPIAEIEKELLAEGVDLERFERELREKIAAKRKEISKMGTDEKELPRMITGDQGEDFEPQERNPKLQEMARIRREDRELESQMAHAEDVELDGAMVRGEETALREAMFEILLHVKDAPLTAESAQEILERHGLEGLMVLVSDDQPEIQEETAAIENLFDDLIDRDALSRELST